MPLPELVVVGVELPPVLDGVVKSCVFCPPLLATMVLAASVEEVDNPADTGVPERCRKSFDRS